MRNYYMIGPNGEFSPQKDKWGRETIFDIGDSEGSETVYSDRLFQWEPKKHDNLCKKYFGDAGQYWGNRKPGDIEKFLSEYLGHSVELTKILEGENQSNGYPYWCFFYRKVV